MDVPAKEYLVCEVRVVIRFLTGIGQTRVEIQKQLKCVYSLKVMMAAMVDRRMEQFKGGGLDVQ